MAGVPEFSRETWLDLSGEQWFLFGTPALPLLLVPACLSAKRKLAPWLQRTSLGMRNEPGKDNPDRVWHEQHAMGVRRASNLVDERDGLLREKFAELSRVHGRDGAFVARLKALADLLADDSWFANVRHWRASEICPDLRWHIDRDGRATRQP